MSIVTQFLKLEKEFEWNNVQRSVFSERVKSIEHLHVMQTQEQLWHHYVKSIPNADCSFDGSMDCLFEWSINWIVRCQMYIQMINTIGLRWYDPVSFFSDERFSIQIQTKISRGFVSYKRISRGFVSRTRITCNARTLCKLTVLVAI